MSKSKKTKKQQPASIVNRRARFDYLDGGNAFSGAVISPYYDSLLVKVTGHAVALYLHHVFARLELKVVAQMQGIFRL